jgi:hypothetical protein
MMKRQREERNFLRRFGRFPLFIPISVTENAIRFDSA